MDEFNDLNRFVDRKNQEEKRKKQSLRSFFIIFSVMLVVASVGLFYKDFKLMLNNGQSNSLTCSSGDGLTTLKIRNLASKYEQKGDLECSISLWKEIVEKRPTDGFSLANLAMRLTQIEQYNEALPYYEQAIKSGAGAYDLFAWYARTFRGVEKTSEAISWYYRALYVHPKLRDVTSELSELLVLKGKKFEALSLLSNFDDNIIKQSTFKAQIISISTNIEHIKNIDNDKEVFVVPKLANEHFFVYGKLSESSGSIGHSFLIDTGASILVFNQAMLDEANIKYKVLKSNVKFKVADGRVVTGRKIELRFFQVGPFVLTNIEAVTCLHCSSLIGQNILNKFDLNTNRRKGVEFLSMTKRTH